MQSTKITCPNCHTKIDVNDVLYKELENEFNKQQRQKLQQEIQQKLHTEQEESLKLLKKELEEKSAQVRELNKTKTQIEMLKREKAELEDRVKAQAQKELNETLQREKKRLKSLLEEESLLKLKEKDEQLEQLKRKLEDAKRISQQGSMQLQGDAQEVMIEQWLEQNFKYDTIEEVKKGAFGADCIQIVNQRELHNCGVICYESKNTKAWSENWIDKLKQDMLRAKADIGVLVTSVMPPSMERMGFYQGIWVCSLSEFKGSVALLRDALIRVHKATMLQENKSDKMSLLYNYLTSSEFSMQFNSIVEGFVKMQEELDKEKRSTQASWKRRQKIIDAVLTNTTEIYGSLQGIAGNSISHIKSLEYDDE